MEMMTDPRYPARMKNLTKALGCEQIDLQTLEKACLIWMLKPEVWSDFHPIPGPQKTQEVFDYEQMGKEDRKKLDSEFLSTFISPYYTKKYCAYETNKARAEWLRERLPLAPVVEKEKVELKIRMFEAMAQKIGAEIGVKECLQNEVMGDSLGRELINIFGGEVENDY